MKIALRTRIRTLSLAVDAPDRAKASAAVTEALLRHVDQHLMSLRLTGMAIFKSYADEVELSGFEKAIFDRAIPYRVLTHADAKQTDLGKLIIVPSVAFDLYGNRLGRGKGFYDRLLATLRALEKDVVAIGVGYDHQLVDRVPTQPHDAVLDFLCTPSLGLIPSKPEKN